MFDTLLTMMYELQEFSVYFTDNTVVIETYDPRYGTVIATHSEADTFEGAIRKAHAEHKAYLETIPEDMR